MTRAGIRKGSRTLLVLATRDNDPVVELGAWWAAALGIVDTVWRVPAGSQPSDPALDEVTIRCIREATLVAVGAQDDAGLVTAELVAQRAAGDVLVARRALGRGPVLVATDFSDGALFATSAAVAVAQRLRSPLAIVHGLGPQTRWGGAVPAVRMAAMNALVSSVAMFGVDPITRTIDRSPADAVRTAARELDARLVVVGARGRGGSRLAGIGAVARDVLRAARGPVLVVRPGAVQYR